MAGQPGGLTAADICDVVYVLLVDRLERMDIAAYAAGAEIDLDERRTEFDRRLDAAPEPVADPERYELMQALGLRR